MVLSSGGDLNDGDDRRTTAGGHLERELQFEKTQLSLTPREARNGSRRTNMSEQEKSPT
jgi:hypothetical protein